VFVIEKENLRLKWSRILLRERPDSMKDEKKDQEFVIPHEQPAAEAGADGRLDVCDLGSSALSGSMAQMQFLAEAARDLNSSLKVEDVLQKIAQRVYNLVDCHLFCVMLWNEEKKVLEHSYSLKFGEHLAQEGSFPLGYGISGTAAELQRPVRVGDVTQDPRYVRFRHVEVATRSELAIPLIFQDRLVGVLDLESMEPDLFTEEHEQMLTALASHMATALVNARLYEKMLYQEKDRERNLATARKIQLGLLPERAPKLEGFEIGTAFSPARELAGDFYDFLPYGEGRIAVAVGDVAGKSTAAALYAALAVGIIRGHVMQQTFAPAELLSHMNEHLLALRTETRFLAMLYALVDAPARTLTLASAAFPYPRLVRDGKLQDVNVSGLPLGLFDTPEYQEIQLQLQQDDVVVICSDGLEDCLYEQGEQLDDNRLDAWVHKLSTRSAQEIAEELIIASEPALHRVPADDRTVVVLKVT